MGNKELFQKIKELDLLAGKYALFGSAPMGIRGLRKCKDIDILVDASVFDEYQVKSGWKLGQTSSGSLNLRKENIEMVKDWKPGKWDENKLIRKAKIINGLPFVKLEEVIKWKKLNGRKKDLKDVEIIEKFLQTQK